jgi:hypothetical protein
MPQPAASKDAASEVEGLRSSIASASGYVLALSYPVLALSTGVRAGYQLFFKEGGLVHAGQLQPMVGPGLSALAACLYLLATVGFARRRRWAWFVSVGALGLETLLTLIVGTLSWPSLYGDYIGGSVWRLYGQDYGYFPLFQPILGLIWLFWPATMAAYGIRSDGAATARPSEAVTDFATAPPPDTTAPPPDTTAPPPDATEAQPERGRQP